MPFHAKIIPLKVHKPLVGRVIGDVIDIIPFSNYEGVEIDNHYVVIEVTDLAEALANELKSGVKRLKQPAIRDGLAFTNQELLAYVEIV